MNIEPIIEPIQPFLTDPRLIEIMRPIQSHLEHVSQDEIDRFRTNLLQKLSEERNNTPFADAVFDTLIRLAKLSPINEVDYITLEIIPDERRVVTSAGYQYDIEALIKYHRERDYRGSALGESPNSKWLINPTSNQPFSVRDVVYIQSVALEKGIKIPHLKVRVPPAPPHPLFSRGLEGGLSGRTIVSATPSRLAPPTQMRDYPIVGNLSFRIPVVSAPDVLNSFEVIINGVPQPRGAMWLSQARIESIRQNIGNINTLKNIFSMGGYSNDRVLEYIVEAEQRAVQEETRRPRM